MVYENITEAKFIRRPKRFIAEVEICGRKETVHVKNTGRCRELLIPGCEVWLTAPGTPDRKTKYDRIALVPNACPMELNRLAQLRGRVYENAVVK